MRSMLYEGEMKEELSAHCHPELIYDVDAC